MTEITLHNYEAFLLDHSENALSAEEVVALEAFARLHPELGISLNTAALPKLLEDTAPFDLKSSLKKAPGDLPDEALLAYLEGGLSAQQKATFEKKPENDPELVKDLELYKKTILQPEHDLTHGSKASLQKTEDEFLLNNRLIRFIESQLSASEKAELEQELKLNPDLQKELALIAATKLIADPGLIYQEKEALKKETKIIALFSLRRFAYAAAMLLLIGLAVVFTVFHSKTPDQDQFTAKHSAPQKQAAPAAVQKRLQTTASGPVITASHPIASLTHSSAPVKTVVSKTNPALPAVASSSQGTATTPQQEEATQAVVAKHKEAVSHDLAAEQKNDPSFSADSSNKINETGLVHQSVLATVEDPGDETPAPQRKKFWKKAVELARHANKLGIKSVDGEEKSGHAYFLSFNSFSVEKK